jgi:AbrB family looped-hinge helix DNA binding protein
MDRPRKSGKTERQGRPGTDEGEQALRAAGRKWALPERTEKGNPLLSEGREPRLRLSARVGPAGRIVIPAEVRAALNLEEGDKLALEVVGDELVVTPQWVGIRRVQEQVAEIVPPNVSLADELIEERRQEAKREDDDA